MTIKFGTDGWRGVIAQDYTFENLDRVAYATAKFYKRHKKSRNGIVVGYDARFMSKEFAARTAGVIANQGMKVLLADTLAPTPAVSLVIMKRKAAGGVVITASHNPYQYNGYKLKSEFGGSAPIEDILKIEKEANRVRVMPKGRRTFEDLVDKEMVEFVEMKKIYLDDIRTKINLNLIQRSGIKIVHDSMYGAGQNTVSLLLPHITQLESELNPSFAGINPEPLAHNLKSLLDRVRAGGFDIGIATDGDADRIGAADEKGNFVDSHHIFALLLKYLVKQKGWTGDVVKSISVGQMVNAMCEKYCIPLYETPVGFKYISELMLKKDILIGGEESGGIGIKGHLPERDGVFNGLLLCEILATRKMKLSELVEELAREFGKYYYSRIDAHTTEAQKQRVLKKCQHGMRALNGYRVRSVQTIDGFKYLIDGGWLLIRVSGTEPLLRFYAEGDSREKVERLLDAAVHL
jgi:phosphomannomutase